ncbi:MAG: CRISPR-associated endonuclease Cas2 [Chromatiales bacterium]|nr:CRISPR-associated endonuclease Cas2 [Chromatiales bacterium]
MTKPSGTRKPRDDPRAAPPLCAYRLMWMLVMFDLPVDTAENRKAANDFRNDLLDFGFERCQFSVYLRFVEGREQADTWTRRVKSVLPPGGKVYCLYFTDKQYQGIVRFERRKRQKPLKNPDQFQLF